MMVADGDQRVVLDDEGDGRGFRLVVLAAPDQVGGHEGRAVLLVEPARCLDLCQFLAGRNVDAQCRLDRGLLRVRGLHEVQPDGACESPTRRPPGVRSGSHSRFHRYRACGPFPISRRYAQGPRRPTGGKSGTQAQSSTTLPQDPCFISSNPCAKSAAFMRWVMTLRTSSPDCSIAIILYQVSNISRP